MRLPARAIAINQDSIPIIYTHITVIIYLYFNSFYIFDFGIYYCIQIQIPILLIVYLRYLYAYFTDIKTQISLFVVFDRQNRKI